MKMICHSDFCCFLTRVKSHFAQLTALLRNSSVLSFLIANVHEILNTEYTYKYIRVSFCKTPHTYIYVYTYI